MPNIMSDETAPATANGASAIQSNGHQAQASNSIATHGITNGANKAAMTPNGSSNGVNSHKNAVQLSSYYGHSREEVTRILIQALSDMGYQEAAANVSSSSGCDLESPSVAAFRSAVLAGSWDDAEQLLTGASSSEDEAGQGNGLVLAAGSDKDLMRFWLRQQKFLEMLEQRNSGQALAVLRRELTPLNKDTTKLHFLSSLLMCGSAEEFMAKANWDGSQGESRRELLSELSRCISPSVMLPEHRLAVLLQHVKQSQIDSCLYHTTAASPSLYSDHFCERRHFPTEVAIELRDLVGEVWQVQFSHNGTRLAACGSSDNVVIWDCLNFSVASILPDHDRGVCNIAWSPDDSKIVTCSRDKHARLWDAKTGTLIKKLKPFDEAVCSCVWSADSSSFTVGTLAKSSSICTFNVHNDEAIEWDKRHRVRDLCSSPDGRWLAAIDNQGIIHVYNAITKELEYDLQLKAHPISVSISEDSRHLLVNKRDGEAQLIDLASRASVQKFLGHTGGECVIRATFGGANESFVVSGSEDGNIVIWHKNTGAAIERLQGHTPRCNAVAWNPADPCMLASCGDDNCVKIWTNKTKCIELKQRHAEVQAARSVMQSINSSNNSVNGSSSHNGWRNSGEDL